MSAIKGKEVLVPIQAVKEFLVKGAPQHLEASWRLMEVELPKQRQPGRYHAWTRSASIYHDRRFKRSVCAVQFDVLDDSRVRVVAGLIRILDLGSKDNMRVGRRRAWILAYGGPPKR